MSPSSPALAPDLAAAAAAFSRWRDGTRAGARIPEALWLRAVELAGTHGVARVAAALRLDYTRLKRRLAASAQSVAPPAPAPAFVELTLGPEPSAAGCVLALCDGRGRSLRIEWSRPTASEVAALARSLWEATV